MARQQFNAEKNNFGTSNYNHIALCWSVIISGSGQVRQGTRHVQHALYIHPFIIIIILFTNYYMFRLRFYKHLRCSRLSSQIILCIVIIFITSPSNLCNHLPFFPPELHIYRSTPMRLTLNLLLFDRRPFENWFTYHVHRM